MVWWRAAATIRRELATRRGGFLSPPTFDYVEARVRKKAFGIFTAIDTRGRPHSTGVPYGVGPITAPLAFYIVTFDHYAKVRYLGANLIVTLAVTSPHRILSFAPPTASPSAAGRPPWPSPIRRLCGLFSSIASCATTSSWVRRVTALSSSESIRNQMCSATDSAFL